LLTTVKLKKENKIWRYCFF